MLSFQNSVGLLDPISPSHSTLRHPNLVCLIGVALDSNPIYLVTEYMAKVWNWVIEQRDILRTTLLPSFLSPHLHSTLFSPPFSFLSLSLSLLSFFPSFPPSLLPPSFSYHQGSLVDYLRSRGRAVISKRNQLDFAKHVCKGMVYLESKSFVHRLDNKHGLM